MSWSKQLLRMTFAGGPRRQFKVQLKRLYSWTRLRLAVRASLPLLRLARAGTGRIGLPAPRAGLGHQAVQRLCFAVEHRAGLLAAQNDELERVHEHLIELAAALTEADWRQCGQRIFC